MMDKYHPGYFERYDARLNDDASLARASRRRRRADGARVRARLRGTVKVFRVSAASGGQFPGRRAAPRVRHARPRPPGDVPHPRRTSRRVNAASALSPSSLADSASSFPSLLQVGMRHFHKQKNHYHCPIINLDKLWTLVGEEKRVSAPRTPPRRP